MKTDTHHFGIGSAEMVETSWSYWRQVSLPVIQVAVRQAPAANSPMATPRRRACPFDRCSDRRLTWIWALRRVISGTERKITAARK
jgi:hypothetical protein